MYADEHACPISDVSIWMSKGQLDRKQHTNMHSAPGTVYRDLCLMKHLDGPRAAVCRGENVRLARIAQLLLVVAPLIRNPKEEYPYSSSESVLFSSCLLFLH